LTLLVVIRWSFVLRGIMAKVIRLRAHTHTHTHNISPLLEAMKM
jgi:hypothetical protein